MRLARRIKYVVAELLNRRDDVCWADAVSWVEYGHDPVSELPGSAQRSGCKGAGLCYCGKFCDGRRSVPADFEGDGELPEPF